MDRVAPRLKREKDDDAMSKDALTRLKKMIRAAVTHAGGDLDDRSRNVLAADLSTETGVWLIVGATPELITHGAAVQQHHPEYRWARALIGDILPDFGQRRLDQIAQGLVALLEEETLTFRAERMHRRQS
jgi:hypothetical protein